MKEPVDPNAPKKCDVIVLSGRKERCEAAVEALKVYSSNPQFIGFCITLEQKKYNLEYKGNLSKSRPISSAHENNRNVFICLSSLGFGACHY